MARREGRRLLGKRTMPEGEAEGVGPVCPQDPQDPLPTLSRVFPPAPFLRSFLLVSVLVWAAARGFVTAADRVLAGITETDPGLRPWGRILLLLAVGWITLQDVRISREREFLQDLGVAPLTLYSLAAGTALACELLLSLWPLIPFLPPMG